MTAFTDEPDSSPNGFAPSAGADDSELDPDSVGAVSSITAAFIAQLLTIGVADRLAADGATPPVYISANIPEGDAHNNALEARFGNRIKRGA
jgi:uncharacterized phosphosugar-binding protein